MIIQGYARNMRGTSIIAGYVLLICACIFLFSMPAWSAEYEVPLPVEAAKIHGRKAFGTNYQLQNPVHGDGFLRFYKLSTFYGSLKVVGDELLKVRFKELAALQQLDEVKLDAKFNRKFDQVIENSLSFMLQATLQRRRQSRSTTSGVEMMFQNIGEGPVDPNNKTAEKGGSSTEISHAKRQIAFHLGVDPYTDFAPLAKRLNLMSRAGEKGVRLIASTLAALNKIAAPAPKHKITPSAVQVFIRDNTPSQLKIFNRKTLIDMDIDEGTVDMFLSNTYYTISDQTALTVALSRLENVSERHIFLSLAAIARHREVAFFHRRRAELIADYHENITPLKNFISVAEFPFAQSLNGKLLGFLVVDELVWTPVLAQAIKSISASIKAQKLPGNVDLHITGSATKMTKSNLEQLKWNVFTKADFR